MALVQMATATSGALTQETTIYGAIEAGNGTERTLSAPAEAMVVSINAPAGTPVSSGTLVVQLAPSPQSALDRAKAQSDAVAADNAYARELRLKQDGLVGNAEVEAAHATAQAADATRASLVRRVGDLTLYAHVSGVVDAVLVKPGDLVSAGTPIVRIATGGAMRARFGIDPGAARRIGNGASLRLESMAGGIVLNLPVTSVHHVVDPTTRLAALFADVPAGSGFALGEPVKGTLFSGHGQIGITIPYAAVQDDGGVPFVYVVSGDVAHKKEVTLGTLSGDNVIVQSGLKEGDKVITVGGTAVEDGMKVRTGALKDDANSGKDKGE
ncbi:MAG: efflux RND transporter periplasmic adaptor subunit [Alphaproteobacteria bacterium]|nr:efflux RND transporter periplasmic adaptor subunit [Alphaproteobacteria bacterium]